MGSINLPLSFSTSSLGYLTFGYFSFSLFIRYDLKTEMSILFLMIFISDFCVNGLIIVYLCPIFKYIFFFKLDLLFTFIFFYDIFIKEVTHFFPPIFPHTFHLLFYTIIMVYSILSVFYFFCRKS